MENLERLTRSGFASFSSFADSRYRRGSRLRRVRYGVSRSSSGGIRPDRSQQVYARSILRSLLSVARRRTKLEGISSNERTRRRSGKRIQTYSTEWVKVVRRRTTAGCRRGASSYSGGGRISAYEYPLLIRLSTLALMRLVNANDRIGIYIAIEWLSLSLYVLAGFRRGSAYSTEAGLKYYVVGAFGSAWMLLGMTLVYGWRGTLNRREIERRRFLGSQDSEFQILYRVGWRFIRGAFLLKLAGVPLHRWLADVYEGAPRPSVLYFAVVPKLGLFRIRLRLVSIWYVQLDPMDASLGLTGSATVTNRRLGIGLRSIGVGAIGALTQRRRKRFRAYSSIGHTGYMVLGVRRGSLEGVQGVRIYLRIYRVMTMVMWQMRMIVKVYEVQPIGLQLRDVKYRTDFYQLGKENPGRAGRGRRTCMSIAGIPPLAGFGAKRGVFRALVASSYVRLAATAVRRSVVSAYNYLRRVKRMFFEDTSSSSPSGVVSKLDETTVRVSQPVARIRGREGRWRIGLRLHPSSFLLFTHRRSLQLVSR